MMAEPAAAPDRIGAYRLFEALGRGGMGIVYRAEHVETREPAALKTLHVPDERHMASLRREIQGLARLRHSGVARILDEGMHNGLPWYAMELVEQGRTLRQVWREQSPKVAPSRERRWQAGSHATRLEQTVQSTDAEPTLATWTGGVIDPRAASDSHPAVELRAALGVFRHLCGALSFLHGEGFVHRDLKPENVLVRSDGTPVLVDFGLMTQFAGELSREALEPGEGPAGTISYMAPEQVRGDLVDARADLYALGCMLYEAVTGRPPFIAATPQDLLAQQLRSAPLPPSTLADNVPAALERLILHLLAKWPTERIGHADYVGRVLAELGADGPREPPVRARPYLYRPRLLGRGRDLDELRTRVDQLLDGHGQLVLLGGQSGIGKTRMVMELAREARERGAQVLVGECQPLAASAGATEASALQGLRGPLRALADRCHSRGVEETERLFGGRAAVLAAYEPLLGALPGAPPGPAAELPADAARIRLFTALADSLGAYAADGPVLLILDDLQWADELTLAWLDYLRTSRVLAGIALLVLGTYRREDEAARQDQRLGRLVGALGGNGVALGRLDDASVAEMVGDMLALQPPPQVFSRFLARVSEGVPFFVAEYLRTAIAEGLLWRNDDGQWEVSVVGEATEEAYARLPLPRSLRELVERHLSGLSDTAGRLVRIAAVVGRECGEATLAAIAADLPLQESIAELLQRQVLEAAAGGGLRFTHDKQREVAYDAFDAPTRARVHRSLAAILTERAESEAAIVAHHWEQGGEPRAAAACYLTAARQAHNRLATSQAEQLYRSHLRLADPTAFDIAEARLALADLLLVLGRYTDAIEELRAVVAEAQRTRNAPLEGRARRALVLVLRTSDQFALARLEAERALAVFEALDDELEQAKIRTEVGLALLEEGHPEAARDMLLAAIATRRRLGDRRDEAYTLGALAHFHDTQGNFREAQPLWRDALGCAIEVGNRFLEGQCLRNLALNLAQQGLYEESVDFARRALDVSLNVNDPRTRFTSLATLAMSTYFLGDVEGALSVYDDALTLARKLGSPRAEAATLMDVGIIHAEQGRAGEARRMLERSLRMHRELGARRLESDVLVNLAALERRCGASPSDVERLLQAAESGFEELGGTADRVLCLCERGHLALQRAEPAAALLAEAERNLEQAGVSETSHFAKAVARLRRANRAFEAGHPLLRGECPDDVPAMLREAAHDG